jgi:hypothetical protein
MCKVAASKVLKVPKVGTKRKMEESAEEAESAEVAKGLTCADELI